MRERDGRSVEEIRAVFKWPNSDSFWQTNIGDANTMIPKTKAFLVGVEKEEVGRSS